jgi:hypothetical protein
MTSQQKSRPQELDSEFECLECERVIKQTWDFSSIAWREPSTEDPIRYLIKKAFQNGMSSAKDIVDVSNSLLSTKLRERMDHLKEQGIPEDMHMSDGIICLLFASALNADDFSKKHLLQDQTTAIREVGSLLASRLKGSVDVKPLNFDRWLADFDHDNEDAICKSMHQRKELLAQYKGINSAENAMHGFVSNITAYHVILDKSQGMSPNKSLLTTLHAQGMLVQMHNNAVALDKELNILENKKPFFNTRLENPGHWLSQISANSTLTTPQKLKAHQTRYLNPLTPRGNTDSFNP